MYAIKLGQDVCSVHPTLCHVLAALQDRHRRQRVLTGQEAIAIVETETVFATGLSFDCNHCGPNLDHLGSARDVVMKMLREVLPFVTDADGKPLKPHQMRCVDWDALTVIGSVAHRVIPCFSSQNMGNPHEFADFVRNEVYQAMGYGTNGPSIEGVEGPNKRHEVHVAYALVRGDQVPQDVIEDYLGTGYLAKKFNDGIDLRWVAPMLTKPFLRGRFRSAGEAVRILSTIDREIELTEENIPALVELAGTLPADAPYVVLHNLLYIKGWIKPTPVNVPVPSAQPEPPVSELAARIHKEVMALRLKRAIHSAQEQVGLGRMTQQEYDWKVRVAELQADTEGCSWANRVAKAIACKDLAQLLDILDCSRNEASQRVCEKEFGVKLRNVKAAERRRAVFRLVGYESDESVAKAEADLTTERLERQKERDAATLPAELQGAKDWASGSKIRVKGHALTGAEFVESLVEQGYTDIKPVKHGAATKYYLFKQDGGSGWSLSKRLGTLKYAQLLLQSKSTQSAVPTAV